MARTTARSGNGARGAALTPESIVDHALAILERPDTLTLSLRKLGEEMGVDPTAFYRHFRDKDDLVLAVWDRVMGEQIEQLRTLSDGLGWRERLRSVAMGSWETALRHPALYSRCYARVTGGPNEREIVEFLLSTLTATGLPPEEAVLYYRVFADSLLGACATTATVLALEPDVREKDINAWSRIYAVLPREQYPSVRAHGPELSRIEEQTIYETLIDALLDRIEAVIADTAAG
jgi:AcrR family transcriptional regulator